jgi:hypothetical protein
MAPLRTSMPTRRFAPERDDHGETTVAHRST